MILWLTTKIMGLQILWLRRLLLLVLDNWKHVALLIALIAACLLARCAYVDYRVGQNSNALNGSNANQSNIGAGIVVLESEQTNANQAYVNAHKDYLNTNAATRESLSKDSSAYSGVNAGNRFCERNFDDSTCGEYRKTHERKVR